MESVAPKIELNRQIHPVTHEIDITLDGLGRYLQIKGQLGAIRETVAFESFVNPEHPRQRRARQLIGNLWFLHHLSLWLSASWRLSSRRASLN